MSLNALLIAGEVQPAVSADPRTEVNLEKSEKNPDKSILNKSFPRSMAQRGEDFLYFKHMQGNAPHATLLMEMLHAKKR